VANLATFTAYHSISDLDYLLAYTGVFGILWETWFQITLHDVRFARDSLYERICKNIQLIVFVGVALVGALLLVSAPAAAPQLIDALTITTKTQALLRTS
jgi:hypothetical protein